MWKSKAPGFEINSVVMKNGATLYPGVESTIQTLFRRVPLFIVSNLQQNTGNVPNGRVTAYFKDALCNGDNGPHQIEISRLIVQRNPPETPVYIGDTSGDPSGRDRSGVDYVHADYGFGRPNSDCIADQRIR